MANVLESMVTKYADLDSQIKTLKKESDPLNKAIKGVMSEQGLSKFEAEGVKVTFQVQERNTTNEDKLLLKLKALGLTEAIKVVEKPDEAVIEQLIYEGKLPAAELASCVETKYIEVLKVTGGKKK